LTKLKSEEAKSIKEKANRAESMAHGKCRKIGREEVWKIGW